MKKQVLFFVIGVITIALLFVLGACPVDNNGYSNSGPDAFPDNPTGSASGTAPGYHGDVTVEITMEDGWITKVTIDGPEESLSTS